MRSIWRTLGPLLVAMMFLEIGSGLLGVLVPYRAQSVNFPVWAIGLLGTAYYAGFVIGCIAVPSIIARFGHIRAFTGLAGLTAAGILAHGLFVSEGVWIFLRGGVGFCFAGLYLAVESWLNTSAADATRGRVLSSYVVVSWVGVISGKLIFGQIDPALYEPFAVAALAICLSTVFVAFASTPQPLPPPPGRLQFGKLYQNAPVGLIGCILIGAANGSFWSLAPVFIATREHTPAGVGLFMAFAVLGGAVSQWPLGWVSDRMDRRLVILLAALSAGVFALALALVQPSGEAGLFALAAGFGATALPLYSLCVAHANDSVVQEDFVEVSGSLLMAFGVGATAGPFLAAFLMDYVTSGSLFLFTGMAHFSLAAYVAIQVSQRSAAPKEQKSAFVSVPKSTQATIPLDPRTPSIDSPAATAAEIRS